MGSIRSRSLNCLLLWHIYKTRKNIILKRTLECYFVAISHGHKCPRVNTMPLRGRGNSPRSGLRVPAPPACPEHSEGSGRRDRMVFTKRRSRLVEMQFGTFVRARMNARAWIRRCTRDRHNAPMGQLSATEIARKGGFVLQRCLLDWSFHRDAIKAVRWWAAVFTRARSIFPQP
jgi:hypothetical protein